MKLRLNRYLKTAVLAAMAAVASFTYADTTLIAEGIDIDNLIESERFYDTGKGHYFSWYSYSNYWNDLKNLRDKKGSFSFLGDVYERMPSKTTTLDHDALTDDAYTCWAQASMNLVEYWHSYYGVFCKDSRELTYGLCYDKQYLDETGGTLSLKQNLVFLDTFNNTGDNLWSYLDWVLLGDDSPYYSKIEVKGQGGFWKDYFTTSYSTRNWYNINTGTDIEDLTKALLTTLGYTQNNDGTYTQSIKGQIVYLSLDATNGGEGHGITCHGVELDDVGKVKALYVTNSDDLEYKLFKLYIKQGSSVFRLYTNAKCTELWEYADFNWAIDGIGGIRTPKILQDMLAEYEDADNALVWTGHTATNGEWDLSAGYTAAYLPNETTGWEIAVSGYLYASFYDSERIICFDDYADSGAVSIKNSGSAHQMNLCNNTLAYTFTGEGKNTLTVDTLVADGGGKASFSKMQLNTTAADISNHTISIGGGATWLGNATVAARGTVDLSGGTLALTKLTLNGGTLSVTGSGTLQSGSIVSSNGATLLFTPTGSNTTPMLTIGSGVSISGSALDIAMDGASLVFDTTYALISFENAQTNWQQLFTTEQGEFTYTDNVLYLIYNPVPKLTWSSTNGTWSSTKWGSTTTDTTDTRAEFTGSGTRNVTISGTVTPYSVKVDNSGAITFTGSGNIGGSGMLTKSGSGSLTINSANSYSGGTTIKAGTVTTGSATALGSGGITLEGGTLNLSAKALSNALTVTGDAVVNGGSAYNGVLVLENGKLTGEALRLGKNATVKSGSIANALTGTGKVTKTGTGSVTLSGANTYSGGTAISGGTLVAGHASALGSGAVTISSGTLNMNGKALSNAVKVSSGNAQILNGGNYTGALTLSGGTLTVEGGDMDCSNLTLSGGIFLLDNSSSQQGSPMVDVAGTLSITASTKIGFTGVYGLGTHILFDFGNLSGSISNLTLLPQSGKTLEYEMYVKGNQVLVDIKTAGALLKWQEAKGTWSVGGGGWQQGKKFEQGDQAMFTQAANVTLQGNLAPSVIEVNSAQAVVFSGPGSITGTADLTKKGNGVLTLNPANPNWKGDTYLKGGTITATGNTSFGKGDIHASSGTLNLAGKAVNNDIYVSTTSSGYVCISGGNKYTGSVDVKGNLSGKTVLQIAAGETLTLHGGKHSATITGQGTMHIADGSVTLQTGKYTMSGLKISGKLKVNKQGLALAKTNSTITLEPDGTLNSAGKISGCDLNMNGGTISMNNAAPATITLTGAFAAKANAEVYLYGAFKSNSFTLNESYFRMYGEKPQAITIAKEMRLIGGKGLTTTGNITAGSLVVDNTKLTINSPKPASLTLKDKTTDAAFSEAKITIDGKLTAAAGIKLTNSTLTLADPTGKNAPQALSSKGKLSLLEGSVLNTNGKVSVATLEMDGATLTMSNAKPQSLALTGKTDANKQPITSHISNSTLLLNGSMSVAANLVLNNATIQLRDANTAKPKALGLAVKGDLTLGGNSLLYLSGALSAKNLTLGSGSIYMTGEKLQTIKVSNELTLNGGTDLNFGFSITQKDFDKNKAFKILTFKVLDAAVEAADLYSLLGLSEDICTLAFDKSRKSITLVVDDMEEWNKQAEAVRKGEIATAVTTAEAAEEAEDMLFAPGTDAAVLEPELAKVTDTLVQSTWGTVGASRAFGDTIANRGAHATLLDGGKGAAWISTMGGSRRISSDGAHAGADYTLTGAAFGMEAHITADSVLGLAVGNSWGKVSTFSAYPVDQDSTHMGIYGNHKLNDTLTLSWMAAHTRTESEVNLAGLPCSWSQDALQLDARLTWARALTARTTVNAFGGLQYLATDSGESNGIKTGSLQNLRAEIGVGATHKLSGNTLAYGELSFVGDMVRNNPTADLGGIRSHGTNPGRAGMNLSVGASHRINTGWSVNASYNFELMQNITSHSLNLGATYSF